MNVANRSSILNEVDNTTLDLSRDLDALKTTYKVNRLQWGFSLGLINRQYTRLIATSGASVTSSNVNKILIASGGVSPLGASAALHTRASQIQRGTLVEMEFDAQFTQDNFLGVQKMGAIRIEETAWFGTFFQGTLCVGVDTGGRISTFTITVTSPSTSTHTAVASIPSPFGGSNTLNISMITSSTAVTPVNHTAYQIATAIRNAQLPAAFIENNANIIRLYYVYAIPIVGTFSITSSSVVVSQVQDTVGSFATTKVYPRSNWNQNSDIAKTLNYTQPNQYKISICAPPFGTLDFSIYNAGIKSYELVHRLPMGTFGNFNMYPLVATAQGNPDPGTNPGFFPPNLSILTGGGSICSYPENAVPEGRIAIGNSLSIASNIETPIISCRTNALFNNSVAVGRLVLDYLSLAANSTQRIRFNLYKGFIDPALAYPLGTGSTTNYSEWKTVANSLLVYDTTATTVNLSTAILVLQVYLANTGTQIINLENHNLNINEGEVFILTALGPSTPDVAVSLSFIEIY